MIASLRRSQGGSALAALLIAVVVCGALSAAVLTTNSGRGREAQAELASERAFELAEAGAEWGLSQIRIANGVCPTTGVTRTVDATGSFVIVYLPGDTDGADTDGDGIVDDAGESAYSVVLSTGVSGGAERTVQVIVRRAVDAVAFPAAVNVNVDTPVVDLSGTTFTFSGEEHLLDGTLDTGRPARPGLASAADVAVLEAQISAAQAVQITGLGGSPSVTTAPPVDLGQMIEQAMTAANVLVEPGSHCAFDAGTATSTGVVTAYCGGNLTLTGTASGAGLLVVDGDLTVNGSFDWVGIVVVRGRVHLASSVSSTRVVGALTVGDEIAVGSGGTVVLAHSSDAIALATQSFATMAVMSWREVARPTP